ncbi:MAG: helix-turn-helix transcriptional regulator [Bacteroidales bacterium]|nr:helix-turn-helix transcriptional regulator [Bacteroidales bacterium]
MKEVKVLVERGKDGRYSAYIADGSCEYGCMGEGDTAGETEKDFLAGVEDMRRVYQREGKVFPEYDFSFKYDLASFLSYYAYAFTLAGLERITGVNQRQLSHYATGLRRPSSATVRKIEKAVKAFGEEISRVCFL